MGQEKPGTLPAPYIWIYELWRDQEILYVGKTRNLKQRLAQHADNRRSVEQSRGGTAGHRAWQLHTDVVATLAVDPEVAAQERLRPVFGYEPGGQPGNLVPPRRIEWY